MFCLTFFWLTSIISATVARSQIYFNSRIINGTELTISEIPYQVSVQFNNHHRCGGVLISSSHVLTAAHCLHGFPGIEYLKIRFGSSSWERGGIHVGAKFFKQHQEFVSSTNHRDVAMIKLEKPVTINNTTIGIIEIANETPIEGTPATVSGWGITYKTDIEFPKILRKTNVKIISHQKCEKIFEETNKNISRSMLCATSAYRDSCVGDSGGPLVVRHKLVGLVSWGIKCGGTKYPGVYTDVSDVSDWIKMNMI